MNEWVKVADGSDVKASVVSVFCISVVCGKTDKKLPYGKTEEKMKK